MTSQQAQDTPIKSVQLESVHYETLQKEFDTLKQSYNNIENKLLQLLERIEAPKQETELITTKEVCKLLGVSSSTLHIWRKQGIIKGFRVGNKVRFKKTEILEAITEIKPSTQG